MPSPGEDVQSWSTTAANNGTADPSINWAEGQARASVNNSARSMMAAHAKDRNLTNGSIVTTGSGNAQAFLSGLSYTTIPTNLVVRLKIGPGLTNVAGSGTTLNMDGLGATEIRTTNGDPMRGGELCADGYVDLLYNGTNWIFLYSQQFIDNRFTEGGGLVIGTQIFTASGTYTPTTGMECCIIECVGGGGGGGGGYHNMGDLAAMCGGGGGSGGYSRKVATAADIGASVAVTVGAGGAGGSSTAGTAGGDSSLGALCVGKGGSGGGLAVTTGGGSNGGAGGVAGTGNVVAVGAPGGNGIYLYNPGTTVPTTIIHVAGEGGSSIFGGGGAGAGIQLGGGTTANGTAGSNYGSGGGGGASSQASFAGNGGAGSGGVVIITEFAGRGAPGRDGATGPQGPIGPAGPAGAGTGDVLRFGTPTIGQVARWTDAAHIQGVGSDTIGFGPPQGRLSLSGLVPVVTTSITASTAIAYSAYVGDKVPLWDGTNWTMTALPGGFATAILTDATKNPAAIGVSKVNDWFIWNDAGTIRLSHGPDWTNDTTRSAGTALVRVNGILLNSIAITNACGASRGTYVGTTRSNGTSTLDWIFGATAAGGTAAFFGVWNAYNRVDVATLVADNTDTWTYSATAFRAANGSNAMRVSFVRGLDEDGMTANYCGLTSNGTATNGYVGVGLDSTSAASGIVTGGGQGILATAFGSYVGVPGLGFHFVQAVEKCQTAALISFYGDAGLGIQSGLTTTLKA